MALIELNTFTFSSVYQVISARHLLLTCATMATEPTDCRLAHSFSPFNSFHRGRSKQSTCPRIISASEVAHVVNRDRSG